MIKHKFNIFPEMQMEDYSRLLNDIKTNGFDKSQPIYIFQDEILDGWNRYRACNELSVKPEIAYFVGTDYEAINFVMRTNKRRNLNSSQWACIASEADDLIKLITEQVEKERREKQAETLKQTLLKEEKTLSIFEEKKDSVCVNLLSQTEIKKQPERVSTKIAETFNTNRTYVSDATKLKERNPIAFEQVKSGLKTLTEIKKEEKKAQHVEKKKEYEQRIETVTVNEFKVDIFNTDKKFRVIYSDPAWSYNDKQDTPMLGGAAKHYHTMSVSEICNLPVKNIAEKDSVLFLWVTSPLLEDAFKVINEWGFKYKTSFIWDKVKHNMGHYNSVRHEILLIATKGSCTPDNKKLYDSVQSIERNNNHSEKPIEFLNIIDDIYNYGNKLEMFCRKIKKENWFGWGNEL